MEEKQECYHTIRKAGVGSDLQKDGTGALSLLCPFALLMRRGAEGDSELYNHGHSSQRQVTFPGPRKSGPSLPDSQGQFRVTLCSEGKKAVKSGPHNDSLKWKDGMSY